IDTPLVPRSRCTAAPPPRPPKLRAPRARRPAPPPESPPSLSTPPAAIPRGSPRPQHAPLSKATRPRDAVAASPRAAPATAAAAHAPDGRDRRRSLPRLLSSWGGAGASPTLSLQRCLAFLSVA